MQFPKVGRREPARALDRPADVAWHTVTGPTLDQVNLVVEDLDAVALAKIYAAGWRRPERPGGRGNVGANRLRFSMA